MHAPFLLRLTHKRGGSVLLVPIHVTAFASRGGSCLRGGLCVVLPWPA